MTRSQNEKHFLSLVPVRNRNQSVVHRKTIVNKAPNTSEKTIKRILAINIFIFMFYYML